MDVTCIQFGSGGRNPPSRGRRFPSDIWVRVIHIFTSAEEGGYVFGSVCLSVCPSDYSQTCERILTKFFVVVGHGSRTK